MYLIYLEQLIQYFFKLSGKKFFLLFPVLFAVCLLSAVISAQEPKISPTPPLTENSDELIRVNTNLIQTGVSVFDKNGKFVGNLKQEDFELRVDGKIVPINFFEAFSGQSPQKTADGNKSANTENQTSNLPNRPGRNILFVVDDVHLSFESFKRAKDLIRKFIETEKQPEDFAAIVSSTGKIGSLQRFTKDIEVLRAALEKLTASRDYSANDKGYPPMSEFEAQEIDRNNKEVIDIFAEILLRNYPPELRNDEKTIEQIKEQLRSRAKNILSQSQLISRNTYDVLEQSLRQSGKLDGRKIVFFISDGFLLDVSNTNSVERINRIIDAAARNNAVIYSLDTKGLDASLPEGTAASFRLSAGNRFESQDALSAFANKTGGKFVRNTNDPQKDVKDALEEASYFYLLAWQPEDEINQREKLRQIEITVRGKPQLKVRFQSGYLNVNNQKSDDKIKPADTVVSLPKVAGKPKNDQLELNNSDLDFQKALSSPVPVRGLSAEILTNYLEKPGEGSFLLGSVQIKGSNVENDKGIGKVELSGVIYDSAGNRVDYFNKLLSVEYSAEALAKNASANFFYNFQTQVKPGLYQIRIAARDVKSGRIGSNLQQIEIPDLKSGKPELSSLFLTERKNSDTSTDDEETEEDFEILPTSDVSITNVEKRFERSSFLQYKFYIYNYPRKADLPDYSQLNIQIQILSDSKLVATISIDEDSFIETDSAQLLYAAQIPLQTLATGRYQLKVNVQNKISKTETAKTTTFEVK